MWSWRYNPRIATELRWGAVSKTHRVESSRQHPGQLRLARAKPSSDQIRPSPLHFLCEPRLSNSVLWSYNAAESLSGLVATAQTESWSPRGTRIGLRIFALRSSAALFCHRYQSTAIAQGRRPSDQSKRRQGKSREIQRITNLLPYFVLTGLALVKLKYYEQMLVLPTVIQRI